MLVNNSNYSILSKTKCKNSVLFYLYCYLGTEKHLAAENISAKDFMP